MKIRFGWLPLLSLSLAVPDGSQSQLPDGNGRELVQATCTRCHGLDKFTSVRLTHDDWRDVVDLMQKYGAGLAATDVPVVTDYLAHSFPGKAKSPGVLVPGEV